VRRPATGPTFAGLLTKRLKGLEPSTFCMAIMAGRKFCGINRLVEPDHVKSFRACLSSLGRKFGRNFRRYGSYTRDTTKPQNGLPGTISVMQKARTYL
jgi:hypothetical protein